jgi:hypothetical protein
MKKTIPLQTGFVYLCREPVQQDAKKDLLLIDTLFLPVHGKGADRKH